MYAHRVFHGTEKWITKNRFLPLSQKIERKFLTEKENHLQRKPWQIKIHSSKQCETRNSNDKNSVLWIFTSIKTCLSVQKWFEQDGCDLGSNIPKLKALNSPEMPGSSYPSSEPLFGSTFWKSLKVEVSSKKSTREFLASKMVVEVKSPSKFQIFLRSQATWHDCRSGLALSISQAPEDTNIIFHHFLVTTVGNCLLPNYCPVVASIKILCR